VIGKGRTYHNVDQCKDGDFPCAVHSPSEDNPMREWDFVIRLDKVGMMERFCEHGVGHTDPDSLAWAHRHYDDRWGAANTDALATHGCDGCCRA
jgi:hypothetical protein